MHTAQLDAFDAACTDLPTLIAEVERLQSILGPATTLLKCALATCPNSEAPYADRLREVIAKAEGEQCTDRCAGCDTQTELEMSEAERERLEKENAESRILSIKHIK